MQKTLRHITVWFLTANLLISTMGLTVHSLYCICKDSLSLSVFEIESQCGKLLDDSLPTCCRADLAASTCSKDHDCENKDSKFVKLTTQFLISDAAIELQIPDFQIVKSDFIIIDDVMVADLYIENFNKPPPDKPFGKTLLPFIQSFLC